MIKPAQQVKLTILTQIKVLREKRNLWQVRSHWRQ